MTRKRKPALPGFMRPKNARKIGLTAAQINAARIVREFPVEVDSEADK